MTKPSRAEFGIVEAKRPVQPPKVNLVAIQVYIARAIQASVDDNNVIDIEN